MTDDRAESAVEPLTRHTREGKRYVRSKDVEAEIEAALDHPLDQVFQLAASGKLRVQTLVYFMRRFGRNGSPHYDAMVLAFFDRIDRAAYRYLTGIPEHLHDRARDMVRDRMLEWFADDRMDIFEASFKTAVERLYLTARTALKLRMQTELPTQDFADADADADQTGEDAVDALVFRTGGDAMPLAQARAELGSVLALLTEQERQALLHVELGGLTEKEAAQLMRCSDRKVRYLLKSARDKARATRT